MIDRTLSCTVNSYLDLSANAGFSTRPIPADLMARADVTTTLFETWTDPKGFKLTAGRCRPTTAKVPLARSGMHPDVVLRTDYYTTFSARCPLSGRVLLHLDVHRSASGEPTSAKLAVWRPGKPLAFVDWRPSLIRTYLSRACGG